MMKSAVCHTGYTRFAHMRSGFRDVAVLHSREVRRLASLNYNLRRRLNSVRGAQQVSSVIWPRSIRANSHARMAIGAV